MSHFLYRTACFVLTGMLWACAGTMPPQPDAPKPGERKVQYGDVVEVVFEDYPEFNQSAMVTAEGTVRLLGLGAIRVKDVPQSRLTALVAEKYRQILSEPGVSVNVLDGSNFSVYVGGDIKKPGLIQFRQDLTIVQGILLAGGLVDKGAEYEVVIFRDHGRAGVKVIRFTITKTEKLNREFKLAPYDVVFIMKAASKKDKPGVTI